MIRHSNRTTMLLTALMVSSAMAMAPLAAQERVSAADSSSAPVAAPASDNVLPVGGSASNSTNQLTSSVSGPRIAPRALTTAAWPTPNAPAVPPSDNNVGMGPNLALMGAGAAAVVVGLLIGGDGGTAVAVGGGIIGLVGLYRYLR